MGTVKKPYNDSAVQGTETSRTIRRSDADKYDGDLSDYEQAKQLDEQAKQLMIDKDSLIIRIMTLADRTSCPFALAVLRAARKRLTT